MNAKATGVSRRKGSNMTVEQSDSDQQERAVAAEAIVAGQDGSEDSASHGAKSLSIEKAVSRANKLVAEYKKGRRVMAGSADQFRKGVDGVRTTLLAAKRPEDQQRALPALFEIDRILATLPTKEP
jgi:hypothetical protein